MKSIIENMERVNEACYKKSPTKKIRNEFFSVQRIKENHKFCYQFNKADTLELQGLIEQMEKELNSDSDLRKRPRMTPSPRKTSTTDPRQLANSDSWVVLEGGKEDLFWLHV